MGKLKRMRSRLLWTMVAAGLLVSSLGGCGDTGDAEGLFSAASGDASPNGGSGGTSAGGSSGSGGTQDASTNQGGSGGGDFGGSGGGNAGTGGTSVGGSGGTSQGGSGGTSVGGSGGTSVGGSGGTSVGGSGGTDPGGTGGVGATGGTGGAPNPDGDIPCPSYNPFDPQDCTIPGGLCCVSFADPYQGTCVSPADGQDCETVINCAGPVDCPPGTQCCGNLLEYGTSNRYERVVCRPNCDGPADVVFCDPYDAYQTCPLGLSCEPSSILPDGYSICRN